VKGYFPHFFTTVQFSKGKTVIFYVKLEYLLVFAKFMKYNWWFRAETLFDLFANDFPSRVNRFELSYCLLSTKRNERFYLRTFVSEGTIVPSFTALYTSAN